MKAAQVLGLLLAGAGIALRALSYFAGPASEFQAFGVTIPVDWLLIVAGLTLYALYLKPPKDPPILGAIARIYSALKGAPHARPGQ